VVRRENFEMEIAEESFAFSGPKGANCLVYQGGGEARLWILMAQTKRAVNANFCNSKFTSLYIFSLSMRIEILMKKIPQTVF